MPPSESSIGAAAIAIERWRTRSERSRRLPRTPRSPCSNGACKRSKEEADARQGEDEGEDEDEDEGEGEGEAEAEAEAHDAACGRLARRHPGGGAPPDPRGGPRDRGGAQVGEGQQPAGRADL